METLKDIETKTDDGDTLLYGGLLRQIAIEWLKDDDFSNDEILKRWKKFDKSNNIIASMQSIKLWIKYFFNIKEEDLKCKKR